MKRLDPATLLRDSRTFCMAPWVHLHVPCSGPIVPCCEAKGSLGTLDGAGIDPVWNGAEMKQFRLRLLADQPDERCWKCHDIENNGAPSYRHYFNETFAGYLDRVAATAADGGLAGALPVSWDIRFTNLCNFRCRMCWHGSSSAWFEDTKALGLPVVGATPVVHSVDDPRRFLEQISGSLPHLASVYFAGGEPLLMEGHYLILEELIARGLTGVKVSYVSNLSHLAYKSTSVLDLWQRFPDVTLAASVDGIGARGELIRNGLDWQQFIRNLRLVKERCPHVKRFLATAISVFNVLHFPEMQRHLVEEGLIEPHRWWVHVLQEPPHYAIRILPDELKQVAIARLKQHEGWLTRWYEQHGDDEPAARAELFASLRSIEAFLAQPADPALQADFRTITAQLDARRDERTAAVFPELAPLLASRSA